MPPIPLLKRVTLTLANTNYNLFTLLAGVTDLDKHAHQVKVQADPDAGGARFKIGNSDLSDTQYGSLIFASQVWEPGPLSLHPILLDQIFLRCDTAGQAVNVTVVA